MIAECLGDLKPVIISGKNPAIIAAVAQAFGKEHQS